MDKSHLIQSWDEMHSVIKETLIWNPQDIKGLSAMLLSNMALICDEKVRLVADLKTLPITQQEYERETKYYISKGMAQHEREMMRQLSVPKEMFEKARRVEVLNEMMETCKRYESMIKLIFGAMQVEANLSYQGH